MSGNLHICRPEIRREVAKILYCPKCKRKRRVKVHIFDWYSPMSTCKAIRLRWKNVRKPCGYVWHFE